MLIQLKQPTPTTCGQTCVAMLTGASVEDVCRAAGKNGPTFGADLVRAVRVLGLDCAPRLVDAQRTTKFIPRGIVRIAPGGGRPGHWVAWADGYFIDPATGDGYLPDYFCSIMESVGWRFVSILAVP